MNKPTLAITMGDFNGVGPELVLRSVLSTTVRTICRPILIGSLGVFEYYARRLGMRVTLRESPPERISHKRGSLPVIDIHPFVVPRITPGKAEKQAGKFSGDALTTAIRLCTARAVDGMVTAPVAKFAMARAGFHYPGQTEMVASLSGSSKATMILLAGDFRVGLATVHLPLRDVAGSITRALLEGKLGALHTALKKDFGIRRPRIAVLGLNPHAGERGLLGTEEKGKVSPAIDRARRRGIRAEGPFAADGFFGTHAHREYDAVLAMYHDQGLIPLKMSGFQLGVNYSAGLSIVRTSPDHGTAFRIAGKGIANPSSMIEAIKLAVSIIRRRRGKDK